MFPIFRKNGYVPDKISIAKNFKIDIFVLKYVLDHSKSISWIFRGRKSQKIYFLLSDCLRSFIAFLSSYHRHLYLNCTLNAYGCAVISTKNGPKIEFFYFSRSKQSKKLSLLPDCLKDFIALLLSQYTHRYLNCALNAHGCAVIFTKNEPKIEVFWIFRGRKSRKIYFLLLDRLKDFIALRLSYHRYLYVNCALSAHVCSLFAPLHQTDLQSMADQTKNGVIQSNNTFFVEKFKKFIEKIPQINFYCIFKQQFFKHFQIFEIFCKPRSFGAL